MALLPDYGGGIEYPSAILEATPSRAVLVHEVAHQWFYGMVGNSQFRDPWLDEAFATYAEAVVNPADATHLLAALNIDGDVGAPMDRFAGERNYFAVVYGKGAAALLTARDAAGAAAFDAAIRCYVDANAWRIATPADLGAVLRGLPRPSPSSPGRTPWTRTTCARADGPQSAVDRRRCRRPTPSTRSSSPRA